MLVILRAVIVSIKYSKEIATATRGLRTREMEARKDLGEIGAALGATRSQVRNVNANIDRASLGISKSVGSLNAQVGALATKLAMTPKPSVDTEMPRNEPNGDSWAMRRELAPIPLGTTNIGAGGSPANAEPLSVVVSASEQMNQAFATRKGTFIATFDAVAEIAMRQKADVVLVSLDALQNAEVEVARERVLQLVEMVRHACPSLQALVLLDEATSVERLYDSVEAAFDLRVVAREPEGPPPGGARIFCSGIYDVQYHLTVIQAARESSPDREDQQLIVPVGQKQHIRAQQCETASILAQGLRLRSDGLGISISRSWFGSTLTAFLSAREIFTPSGLVEQIIARATLKPVRLCPLVVVCDTP